MPEAIAEVMRHGPERKSVLVFALRFPKHYLNQIAAADIVEKIRKEKAPQGIVAEVLDDRPPVGKAASLRQLLGSRGRIARQQQRLDCRVPGRVDDGLMT